MVGFRVLTLALQAGYRVRAAVRNQEGIEKIKSLAPIAPYLDQLEFIIVPDITAPGAYDESVKDVEFVIHVASPLAMPTFTDYEREIITPARLGTLTMLEAAYKTPTVKKVVITTSVAAIIPVSSLTFREIPTVYKGMPSLKETLDAD